MASIQRIGTRSSRRSSSTPARVRRGVAASVAEDRPGPIPEPLEQRRASRHAGVRDERVRVELARVHAERARQQLAPALRELLEEALERRASITGDALGMTRDGEV